MPFYNRLSQLPLRKSPDERSEMINQMLYGEAFQIKNKVDQWVEIECLYDGYSGWIPDLRHGQPEAAFYDFDVQAALMISSPIAEVKGKDGNSLFLSLGSMLGNNEKYRNEDVVPNPFLHEIKTEEKVHRVLEYSQKLLQVPYLWGGRSAFGYDCSGFVQILFKLAGIALPRDAWQQAEKGQIIDFLEESKAGDLVFFDNSAGHISHVGILIGGKKVIHASGFVRIDPIDHYGIYNQNSGSYTHKLRIIKRI